MDDAREISGQLEGAPRREQIILLRFWFTKHYASGKGWRWPFLSMDEVQEVRRQKEWKRPLDYWDEIINEVGDDNG